MLRNLMGTVLSGAVIVGVAGCVPTAPATAPAPVVAPAAPVITEELVQAYAARADDGFTVPAVDVAQVPEQFRRQEVPYAGTDPVGTIIIDPTAKNLTLVTAKDRAMRYGIAVGKDGFQWAGEAVVNSRKHWPTWTPPPEMIDRKPELEKWRDGQPGGPTNPLGARALYLTTGGVDYGFRIHGTPEWKSIGRNASSGCFRMINQDVMDLYERVPNGVKVVVLNADGSRPTKLKLPPPAPKKSKPAPKAKPVVTTVAPGAPAPGFPTMTAPVLGAPVFAPAGAVAPVTPVVPAPATPAVPPPVVIQPVAPTTPAPAAVVPAPVTPAPVTPPVVAPVAPATEPPAADTPPDPVCIPTADAPCPPTNG